jgi:glycosyltransferase involved in cell wall biosynthesis
VIYLYSHVNQDTGYGELGRRLRDALGDGAARQSGAPRVVSIPIGRGPVDDARPTAPPGAGDVVIICTLPLDCAKALEIVSQGFTGEPDRIVAYTTWEGLTVPLQVSGAFAPFDAVLVPSRANREVLAPRCPVPVHVVPIPYDDTVPRMPVTPPSDQPFRFYWIGAWTLRKNPLGLVRAFAHAFGPSDGVELLLHSPGVDRTVYVAGLASCGLEQQQLPPITLSSVRVDDDTMRLMHATSDCFVTAARGEAWNLPAFDAMLAGRHVIAPYGMGSDDFLLETSADLIDGWETPAMVDVEVLGSDDGGVRLRTKGAQGLNARSLWVEPNLVLVAEAMRDAYANRRRNLAVNYEPSTRFGYAAVRDLILELLQEIP